MLHADIHEFVFLWWQQPGEWLRSFELWLWRFWIRRFAIPGRLQHMPASGLVRQSSRFSCDAAFDVPGRWHHEQSACNTHVPVSIVSTFVPRPLLWVAIRVDARRALKSWWQTDHPGIKSNAGPLKLRRVCRRGFRPPPSWTLSFRPVTSLEDFENSLAADGLGRRFEHAGTVLTLMPAPLTYSPHV